MLAKDKDVYVIGQGVTSPWYVGSTTQGLVDAFGEKRVIDTPVSENAVTGAAVGSAIAGMRPLSSNFGINSKPSSIVCFVAICQASSAIYYCSKIRLLSFINNVGLATSL